MRGVLYAAIGFLAGGALITGVALVPRHTTVVLDAPADVATPMSQTAIPMGGTMMGSSAMAPAMSRLTIQHVLRGCHTWSNGTRQSPTMRLTVKSGGSLSVLDQDLDAHQMMQLSGPARLHLGGPMMMNHRMVVSFPTKGVYRLRTKTVEMPGGMEVESETVGPDNTLRLIVTVV